MSTLEPADDLPDCHLADPAPRERNNPERALWRAVILQALHDLCGGSLCSKNERFALSAHARHWLLEDNPGFPEVCDMAAVSPHAVRERAVRLYRGVESPPPRPIMRKKSRSRKPDASFACANN